MDENIPNPSTPPLDGPCFFYQLSRELRDMVYEYALSVPEGVSMEIRHIGCSNDDDSDSDSVLVPSITRNGRGLGEVNQLRYVSQQLRLETEGIVLRVNDVHFDILPSLNHLNMFIEDCSTAISSRLNRIILHQVEGLLTSRVLDLLDDTSSISQYCRANPQIRVILRCGPSRSHCYFWLGLHNFASRCFRGHDAFDLPRYSLLPARLFESTHFSMADAARTHLPETLRFTLCNDLDLALTDWRSFLPALSDATFDSIAAAAEKLHAEGV
jgi:hypothetical protein